MSYKIKFLVLIIVFLILNLVLVFFLRTLFLEIKKNSIAINSKKTETLLLDKKAQISEEFSVFFEKEKKNFAKVDSFFINPELPIDFINFLEKTAKDYGLTLELSISPLQKKDGWPFLNFQINLTGFSPEIFKFIKKLNYAPYLVRIESLEIFKIEKVAERETQIGKTKANLLIQVFTK